MDDFFNSIKIIAVVGLSDKPERYSYQVAAYLQSKGFTIIPINPNIQESLGETSYLNLLSIPTDIHIDLVDIFRKSEDVLPHVQEAIQRGDAKTIWMQQGIINEEAKKLAEDHGLRVIMDQCLMVAHKSLSLK